MSPKFKFFIGTALATALIVGASALYAVLIDRYEPANVLLTTQPPETSNNTEHNDQPEVIPAPDFEMYDTGMNLVNLSDFFGKPIVINFWASWCPPCRIEMPYFQTVYDDIGDEVQFLMISLVDGFRETIRTAENFISHYGYTFPVFYDTMGGAAIGYRVTSIPTTVFIDRDGNLAGRWVGVLNEEQLRQFISEIK